MYGIVSLLIEDGRRGHVLLEVFVVEIARNVVEGDGSFIVDSSLHLSHRLLCLFFAFVLDEEIAGICADIFFLLGYEPVVNNCSELRETFD